MVPGGTRSLNLSTAIAIVLYEAARQQNPAW
jgi:tRNA(Leu) C34 or U34 (ribose-2'-O)-methylase TrmL